MPFLSGVSFKPAAFIQIQCSTTELPDRTKHCADLYSPPPPPLSSSTVYKWIIYNLIRGIPKQTDEGKVKQSKNITANNNACTKYV